MKEEDAIDHCDAFIMSAQKKFEFLDIHRNNLQENHPDMYQCMCIQLKFLYSIMQELENYKDGKESVH